MVANKQQSIFIPSHHQTALFDAVESGTKGIVVNAVAGSGKTTTILKLVERLSRSKSIVYVAFGANMVSETRGRVQAKNVGYSNHSVELAFFHRETKSNHGVDRRSHRM